MAAYCVYAGCYIWRTSFVIDGVRYFPLFDDAMISMRYARNLAQGHGLVWNVDGPRVEGFTNFLWVCYMATLHLLGMSAAKISVAVQLSGLGFLIATLFVIHDIALSLYGRSRVALAAVVLIAFYLPLNTWGLQGMEVSALALLASVSVWLALKVLAGRCQLLPVLYLVMGVGTLVRMDMAVLFIVVLSFMLWARRRHATDSPGMGSLVEAPVHEGGAPGHLVRRGFERCCLVVLQDALIVLARTTVRDDTLLCIRNRKTRCAHCINDGGRRLLGPSLAERGPGLSPDDAVRLQRLLELKLLHG